MINEVHIILIQSCTDPGGIKETSTNAQNICYYLLDKMYVCILEALGATRERTVVDCLLRGTSTTRQLINIHSPLMSIHETQTPE